MIVQHDSDNHLGEIGPVIFAETHPPEFLSTLTLEVDRGGIQEYQIQAAEEVSVVGEHPLFNDILGAPWRKRRRARLVNNFLPKKRHGPVEMMKREVLDPFNEVVPAPPVAAPIRTACQKSMQNGEKNGPFDIEPEKPLRKEIVEDFLYSQIFPEPLEYKDRSDLPASLGRFFQKERGEPSPNIEKGSESAFRSRLFPASCRACRRC